MSVSTEGIVTVRVGKVELGQGILTALAQMAADELGVDLESVRMVPANTSTSPEEGFTAGSLSISECGSALRVVAANVRTLFVDKAAKQWNVDSGDVDVERGAIASVRAKASTSYGELAGSVDLEVAADLNVSPRRPRRRRVSGTSAPRLDLPHKVAGRRHFIHDVRLPGQLFGRVVRPPSPGARLVAVDQTAVDGARVQVVRAGSFLGLVGEDEADVVHQVEALRKAATWEERDSLPDEYDLEGYLRRGPHETITLLDAAGDCPPPGPTMRATYSRPFIAHAAMAPSCGVAWWRPDGTLAIWTHSQGIGPLRDAIADALGLPSRRVVVEHAEGAGCYGHNGADDAAFDAALLARETGGRPVLVQWSRHDELAWSPFGSAMTADVEATLDDAGSITSWSYDVWSQGHTSRPGHAGTPGLLAAASLDPEARQPAATDPPASRGGGTTRNAVPIYAVPIRRVVGHRLVEASLRSSALRALGAYLNVFAIESFMDELALHARRDPLEYRIAHLKDQRGRRVLDAAASTAQWGQETAEGVGRGLGFARYKDRGAYCAVVAEIEAGHEIRLRRLTIAVDVGQVVNPDGVRNQIEGGATQSASWTMKERVRFDRRRVTSCDWESYPILQFSEVPHIDVEIVPNDSQPSVGAGEAAQGPTAGAIGNALAAALGIRVRQLPLTAAAVLAAIEAQTGD